jgi:hypothetical protein
MFASVVSTLVVALEQASQTAEKDFAAHRYKEKLCDTLAGAIAKVAPLAQDADFTALCSVLVPKAASATQAFRQALRRAIDEQASDRALHALTLLRKVFSGSATDGAALVTDDILRAISELDTVLKAHCK